MLYKCLWTVCMCLYSLCHNPRSYYMMRGFKMKKNVYTPVKKKPNRCIREHVMNQEKVNMKDDDLKGVLSFVGVQGFTLSWFNVKDAVFRVWTVRLNTTPAASLVWLGVSANSTNRNKLKSTSTLQRWTPPGEVLISGSFFLKKKISIVFFFCSACSLHLWLWKQNPINFMTSNQQWMFYTTKKKIKYTCKWAIKPTNNNSLYNYFFFFFNFCITP